MNLAKKNISVFCKSKVRKYFRLNNLKKYSWVIVRTVLIVGISYIILSPLLTKIAGSFMTERDVWSASVRWIPEDFTFDNYRDVFQRMLYPEAFLNSFILTSITSILQLASCTFIGYGFARFDFKGKKLFFAMVIFTLLVPPHVTMIPQYLNFRYFNFFGLIQEPGINMVGSYWPFILISLTGAGMRNGIFIYMMRQFFKGMPKSLEEAAYVDGAGPIKTFYNVMLPGAVPALVTVFLFAFVWQWNDYFYTSMFMRSGTLLPMTLAFLNAGKFGSENLTTSGRVITHIYNNTGMLMFIAPLLILYAFMQRYFVESIERTGIVG
ncbi:MAG: carbohydrate ABC transporter permease [Halanaerobiales bacterium]